MSLAHRTFFFFSLKHYILICDDVTVTAVTTIIIHEVVLLFFIYLLFLIYSISLWAQVHFTDIKQEIMRAVVKPGAAQVAERGEYLSQGLERELQHQTVLLLWPSLRNVIWAEIQKDLFSGTLKRVQAALMYSVPKSLKDLGLCWERTKPMFEIRSRHVFLQAKSRTNFTQTLSLLGISIW